MSLEGIKSGKWLQVPPGELDLVRAQLNRDERQLLYYIAKEYCDGSGAIVDGGAFVGGSAKCLAIGLRDNETIPADRKFGLIHSCDTWRSDVWIPAKWFSDGVPVLGGSFLRHYIEALGGLLDYVNVHQGDVAKFPWSGEPIDLLFLDLCKTMETTDAVTLSFFPCLVPGRSIVIQQDFSFESHNIWIYIVMERLWDHFEVIAQCSRNSVAFLQVKPFSETDLKNALVLPMSHQERMDLALAHAQRFSGETRRRLEASVDRYGEALRAGHPLP